MPTEVTPKQQADRIRELVQKLAYAELKVESLEILIDLAEKEGIRIRKKGDPKQSALYGKPILPRH